MSAQGRGKRRAATAAAEAGIALAMIFLMVVSGVVGFGIGRHTGGGSSKTEAAASNTNAGGEETVTTSGETPAASTTTEESAGSGSGGATTMESATTAAATRRGGGGGGSAASVASGKKIFASAGCASCHTLKAAGSTGTVGPNLDEAKPSFDKAVERVTHGKPPMPAFKGQLTDKQIRDVARFVSSSTRR